MISDKMMIDVLRDVYECGTTTHDDILLTEAELKHIEEMKENGSTNTLSEKLSYNRKKELKKVIRLLKKMYRNEKDPDKEDVRRVITYLSLVDRSVKEKINTKQSYFSLGINDIWKKYTASTKPKEGEDNDTSLSDGDGLKAAV